MNEEEHKAEHKAFHPKLDEMVAEYIIVTNNYPSKTTLFDFLSWSATMIDQAKETKDELI